MAEEKYDQDFFLALAQTGKDAWNAWRRDPANEGVFVTFAGIDFSEAPGDQIDFTGFEFGDCADFSQCKWRGVDLFRAGATDIFKPGRACFPGASFGDRASFTGTVFGQYASFTGGVVFGAQASFEFAVFEGAARFDASVFDAGVSFRGATFGEGTSFQDVVIGSVSSFDGTAFGDWTFFDAAIFNGAVSFSGKSIIQWTGLFQLIMHGFGPDARRALKRMHEQSWRINGSAPDRFLSISFPNTRFGGNANFSGRAFGHHANFTDARFCHPPDFDAVTNASRIDFTGTHIGFVSRGDRQKIKDILIRARFWDIICLLRPDRLLDWTEDSQVPIQLRASRKLAEETRNHDLERDLYIEERKAERGAYWRRWPEEMKEASISAKPRIIWRLFVHVLWIIIMLAYWALADYGRNVVLPAAWLIASVFFFDWRYTKVLAPLMPRVCPLSDQYEHALSMLALGNAVPFVGPLTVDTKIKEFLFCPNNAASCLPPIPPEGFQLLVILQNLFSITCVFFIALALRNYFKIK